MLGKRLRDLDDPVGHEYLCQDASSAITLQVPPPKRLKPNTDRLTPLSDELLLRILSFLPLSHLIAVAPVSRRLDRLAADSQLWKTLYYSRFVLPRAMRIPGFREGVGDGDHKLHYSGRRRLWADGRRGGLVREGKIRKSRHSYNQSRLGGEAEMAEEEQARAQEESDDEDRHLVDWKRQYKVRHNWARGKCAVEELQMGGCAEGDDQARKSRRRMLVKVVDGIAFTADAVAGLRVWDLKTREILAQTSLQHADEHDLDGGDCASVPTSAAIDDQDPDRKRLDIALGFLNGGFGIWRFDSVHKTLKQRSRHEKSSNGELVGIAYSHPLLITATESVLISLYTLEVVEAREQEVYSGMTQPPAKPGDGSKLPPPYLVTSLRSHTSQPPLALSIRKLASTTIASIAYTFTTRQGWSIGIQDIHVKPADRRKPGATPEVISTRLAYSNPMLSGRWPSDYPLSPLRAQANGNPVVSGGHQIFSNRTHVGSSDEDPEAAHDRDEISGPTTLCYNHPYLLATLPDNTLILHLCTSTSSTLSISPGIRLWGHTSGISDAEITGRGKAVSVSSRGEEMRVWELEGRPAAFNGRSVEIRPNSPPNDPERHRRLQESGQGDLEGGEEWDWDEKRNWVGFDDEMVIVLKEARGGRESLMVYDFN